MAIVPDKDMNKPDKKILHLTLKKKWFDMIASGEKKEEYREIKPYWEKRLVYSLFPLLEMMNYDEIIFTNGYSPVSPNFTIECKGIESRQGKAEWGAEPGKTYYVIKLGEIIK